MPSDAQSLSELQVFEQDLATSEQPPSPLKTANGKQAPVEHCESLVHWVPAPWLAVEQAANIQSVAAKESTLSRFHIEARLASPGLETNVLRCLASLEF